ncbi:Tctex-1 [Tribonema minus]|uniref:Tctex-1 n=1 Tax=Tribonema minus TaxID=303371 RepID=A0A835YG30_9STRA|nr:Tctex-1 [Tribonema minus]
MPGSPTTTTPSFANLQEEARKAITQLLDETLKGQAYEPDAAKEWAAKLSSGAVTALQGLSQHFKYIATCTIAQKCGGGLHSESAASWDPARDGCCDVAWEGDGMSATVVAFATSTARR